WNDLAAGMPPGSKRAEVLAHLGWNSEDDFGAATGLLEQALAEAGDAPALCANIHLFLSDKWAAIGDIERSAAESHLAIPDAELAQAGLEIAERLDRGQLTSALLLGCGFAALGLGQADQVREFAGRGIELSRTVGDRVYLLGNQAILGLLDLALGDFAAAA